MTILKRVEEMQYSLIVAIAEGLRRHGYGRGERRRARGGTVIHAKGTGPVSPQIFRPHHRGGKR
ncbi:MAG: hypothetical protein ACLUEQ_11245 [Cloacibacillus evryensis]